MENGLEQKRSKRFHWVLSIALALFYVLYMLTLDTVASSLLILRGYGSMVVFLLLGGALYRGSLSLKSPATLGLVFILWYLLSRVFLGDTYLQRSAVTFADIAVLYGLALPFAALSNDGEKRQVLDILAVLFALTMAVLAWMSLYLAVTGNSILMPKSGFGFGMGSDSRLAILGQNPNHSAPLMALGIFLTVYLLARYRNKWLLLPGLLGIVGMYGALSLTVSRTAFYGMVATSGVLAALMASRIPVKKNGVKALVIAAAAAVSMLIVYVGFNGSIRLLSGLAASAQGLGNGVAMTSGRDMSVEVQNMSGRGAIYSAIFQTLREQPQILLRGNLDTDLMLRVSEIVGAEKLHCHNSFLQVLMYMGLPGLLIVLGLCVQLALSMLKLFFARNSTMAEKFLSLVPIYLLVSSLAESLIFVPWMNLCWSLLNFWFLLLCGYILVAGSRYKFRDVFYKGMFSGN